MDNFALKAFATVVGPALLLAFTMNAISDTRSIMDSLLGKSDEPVSLSPVGQGIYGDLFKRVGPKQP